LFTYVTEPKLLAMDDPPVPIFALYIAVSNPSTKARELAARAGGEILSKLRL
jgi:hypothetical protein